MSLTSINMDRAVDILSILLPPGTIAKCFDVFNGQAVPEDEKEDLLLQINQSRLIIDRAIQIQLVERTRLEIQQP